jgi:hypothetical protein
MPFPRAQEAVVVCDERCAREGVGERLGVFQRHRGALAGLRRHGVGGVADQDESGFRAGPVGEGRDFEEAVLLVRARFPRLEGGFLLAYG